MVTVTLILSITESRNNIMFNIYYFVERKTIFILMWTFGRLQMKRFERKAESPARFGNDPQNHLLSATPI